MSSTRLKVGADILYDCPRCGLKLGHRILAMVGSEPARVRCNTCQSERNYRRKSEGTRRVTESAAERGKGTRKSHHSQEIYQTKLKESLMRTPYPYTIQISPTAGDVIDHKNFGRGVVLKVIPPDRAEIIFSDSTRVLACKVTPS